MWNEVKLHSWILKRSNLNLVNIPVGTILPSAVNMGYVPYLLSRFLLQIKTRLHLRDKNIPMENYKEWLTRDNRSFIESFLLQEDLKVKEYIDPKLIVNTLKMSDDYWINKLLSLEIILRLFENRWEKFW